MVISSTSAIITLPLITLDEVKTAIGVRAGVTDYDVSLTSMALLATRQIESFCRRRFTRQTFIDVFTPRQAQQQVDRLAPALADAAPVGGLPLTAYPVREQMLVLSGLPIDAASPVLVHYDPAAGKTFSTDQLIAAADYTLDPAAGVLLLRAATGYALNSLQVSYTAGFAAVSGTLSAAAPVDLKQACIMQAIFLWKQLRPDNIGVEQETSARPGGGRGGRVTSSGLVLLAANLVRDYVRTFTGRL